MTCNKYDDISEKQNEIRRLEQERANLEQEISFLMTRRKMLEHRIADLKYDIFHPPTFSDLHS